LLEKSNELKEVIGKFNTSEKALDLAEQKIADLKGEKVEW